MSIPYIIEKQNPTLIHRLDDTKCGHAKVFPSP